MKVRSALLAVMAIGALLSGASPAAAAQADDGADAKAGIGTYNLIIRTGALDNADTEDSVRITVFGNLAKSPPVQIDSDFGAGTTRKFGPYRWTNLGIPGSISLGKSAREEDAWFPEYVQVHDEHNGALYTCQVNEWFPQKPAVTRYYACS